jgi:hypothetical protein
MMCLDLSVNYRLDLRRENEISYILTLCWDSSMINAAVLFTVSTTYLIWLWLTSVSLDSTGSVPTDLRIDV